MQRPLLHLIVPATATLSLLFAQVSNAYMSPDEVFGIDGSGIPVPVQVEEPLFKEAEVFETPADIPMKPAAKGLSDVAPVALANSEFSILKTGGIFLGVLIFCCVGFCFIVGRFRHSSPSSFPSSL